MRTFDEIWLIFLMLGAALAPGYQLAREQWEIRRIKKRIVRPYLGDT